MTRAVVSGGMIRAALAHLSIDRCPRCLRGDLIVDLDRRAISCTKHCDDVAQAVGEAAPRLTGGLRAEGESLMRFCLEAVRNQQHAGNPDYLPIRSADRDAAYIFACGLQPSPNRDRLLDLCVRAERWASYDVVEILQQAREEMAA